jgi:hypothetical protein
MMRACCEPRRVPNVPLKARRLRPPGCAARRRVSAKFGDCFAVTHLADHSRGLGGMLPADAPRNHRMGGGRLDSQHNAARNV